MDYKDVPNKVDGAMFRGVIVTKHKTTGKTSKAWTRAYEAKSTAAAGITNYTKKLNWYSTVYDVEDSWVEMSPTEWERLT